jgi:phasin family protein
MGQAAEASSEKKGKNQSSFNGAMPRMDFTEGLAICRKNMETLASMGKTSMDIYQNLAKLQMGFFQQMMTDAHQAFQKSLTAKNVKECTAHGKEFLKDRTAKAMAHAKNFSSEISTGGGRLTEMVKSHAKDQKQRFKETLKKSAKK